jgi:hypothetical protein
MPKTAGDLIDSYFPLKSKDPICTRAEWEQISGFVRATAGKVQVDSARGIRPYLTATTRISVWGLRNGFPLEVGVLLSTAAIEHFSASLPSGTGTFRSVLRRLADANGVAVETAGTVGYAKPELQAPYSADEVAAMWRFARALTNQHRQVCLRALLVLGLGCGLARTDLRGVDGPAIHTHDGDSRTFVATNGRCVPVAEPYVTELTWVAEQRPIGQLIGTARTGNLTNRHVEWMANRAGVPELSSDRLRSTWMCAHLANGVALVDLMAWSGLKGAASLDGYLTQLLSVVSTCETFEMRAEADDG